jgi:putative sterol carrier protein
MEAFSAAWSQACCERMNESAAYRAAAAGWEGATVLVMAADPARGVDADRAVWLDLHDGACRGTRPATDDDLASAAYVLRADPATWERLLSGEAEPVAAVMSGKLRLVRGNLFALAKYAAAAQEMVAAAGEVGGTFPAPGGREGGA